MKSLKPGPCLRSLGLILLLTLLPILAMAAPASVASPELEKIVALVNDAPIYAADLEWHWRRQLRQSSASGLVIGTPKTTKPQLLEQLIRQELLYQLASQAGFKPDTRQVNKQLNQLKNRFRDDTIFARELEGLGLSEERLRGLLSKSLVIGEFLKSRFVQGQEASDEEGRAWYRQYTERLNPAARVCASHILIAVAVDASAEERRLASEQAEGLRRRWAAGEDFAGLASAHSDCPSAAQGGDLGCFGFSAMVRPFAEAAFALQPDQVSDPVVSDQGVHLIHVREYQNAEPSSYPQMREQALAAVRTAKAQPLIRDYIDSQRQTVNVIVLP